MGANVDRKTQTVRIRKRKKPFFDSLYLLNCQSKIKEFIIEDSTREING